LSVISLPRNSGPAAARNHGIAQATGDWIAFLDADDLWPRARLDIQLQAAAADPEVVLWCGRAVRFDADRHEEQAAALRDVTSEATASAALRRLVLDEFALHNPVATSTVLVRRAVLQACGGFDEQFRGPEDYDLWMRVVSNGPAAFLEADLAWYAQRQGSLSMDDRTFLPQVIRVLDKAFAPGGALHGRRDLRRRALPTSTGMRPGWHSSGGHGGEHCAIWPRPYCCSRAGEGAGSCRCGGGTCGEVVRWATKSLTS
jgi:hypothetical protein